MAKIVTKESIVEYLSTHTTEQCVRFVGRALVVIFNNQTRDEQLVNETNENNGIGFTGADAHSGCLTAKSFLKRGTLQDWQFERWTKPNSKGVPRIARYWKQLNAAAEARRAAQPARANPDDFNDRWAQHKIDFAERERQQEATAFLAKGK